MRLVQLPCDVDVVVSQGRAAQAPGLERGPAQRPVDPSAPRPAAHELGQHAHVRAGARGLQGERNRQRLTGGRPLTGRQQRTQRTLPGRGRRGWSRRRRAPRRGGGGLAGRRGPAGCGMARRRDDEGGDVLAVPPHRAGALTLDVLARIFLEVRGHLVDRAVADDDSRQRILLGVPLKGEDPLGCGIAAATLEGRLPDCVSDFLKIEGDQLGDRSVHAQDSMRRGGPLGFGGRGGWLE